MPQIIQKITSNPSAPRYVAVGIVSLTVDYGVLLILYRLFQAPLVIATTISFFLGLTVNFVLNKYWTFNAAPRGTKQGLRQAVLYSLLVAFNLGFTNIFILSFQKVHVGPEITKPLSTTVITLWNYLLYQKIIFKAHNPTDLERSMM